MAYVYRHIRLDKNVPFYIGIGSEVLGRKQVYKRAFQKAMRSELWKKIAAKGYSVEILVDGIDWDCAKKKEIEFIKLYGRIDLGTGTLANMTDGGDGTINKICNEEYRKKLSEAAKRRRPQPQLQKIIEWRKNNMFWFSDETRRKLSEAHKGKKKSPEHIEKARKAKLGEKNPMFGKTGINCQNFKGYVQAFNGDALVGEYDGVLACAKELNISATKISACLNGKRNTTGGYTFKRNQITTL